MARNEPSKKMPWDDAIQIVLKDAKGALRYTEIAERISTRRLRDPGANPAASVAVALGKSLKEENSPFQRIGRGQYALKASLQAGAETQSEEKETEEDEIFETGALKAFGMFWQRDQVIWGGKPKILGRQGLEASRVNFAEQIGVYLLHDRDRVIYVGRADDSLFARLRFHTTDRLGGRWDRFSWFGLRSVREDGTLSDPSTAWTHKIVIETLEALLIESLEPPLNRRRGDNFSAAEYLQVVDPEIEDRKNKEMLDTLLKRAARGT